MPSPRSGRTRSSGMPVSGSWAGHLVAAVGSLPHGTRAATAITASVWRGTGMRVLDGAGPARRQDVELVEQPGALAADGVAGRRRHCRRGGRPAPSRGRGRGCRRPPRRAGPRLPAAAGPPVAATCRACCQGRTPSRPKVLTGSCSHAGASARASAALVVDCGLGGWLLGAGACGCGRGLLRVRRRASAAGLAAGLRPGRWTASTPTSSRDDAAGFDAGGDRRSPAVRGRPAAPPRSASATAAAASWPS